MTLETLHTYLEISTFIITILGVPTALTVYYMEQKRQREEREYGTYDALDDKYIELQQLCLEYPELDIFDTPFETTPELSPQQEKQEEAILLIRMSIFERAFLMYNQSSVKIKSDQWEGWDIEIMEWLERGNFKKMWDEHCHYYDRGYVDYFNSALAERETKEVKETPFNQQLISGIEQPLKVD